MPAVRRVVYRWEREKKVRACQLTEAERENVKVAIRALRARYGNSTKLAEAMDMRPKTIKHSTERRWKPTAGLAMRVARTAGVAVEAVLGGMWPPRCQTCGRC